MSILVTEQARAEITASTRRGSREHLEFGGSLLAHERDGEILVAYALPTGPRAEQGPSHVRTDAEFQNVAIERVRRRRPELSYVGDWHVHPMWMPRLSWIDEETARGILLEEGAHRERLVLLLGTMPPKGEPVIVGFVLRLRSSLDLEVTPAEICFVDDDSAELRAHLPRPLEPIEDVLAAPVVEPVVLADGALTRIESDLEEIRAELRAEVTPWHGEDLLAAMVRQGRREAVIVFPPEYPLGAPQVFSGSLAEGPLVPVELRYAWSSRHRLVDAVASALVPGVVLRARALGRAIVARAHRSRAQRAARITGEETP